MTWVSGSPLKRHLGACDMRCGYLLKLNEASGSQTGLPEEVLVDLFSTDEVFKLL